MGKDKIQNTRGGNSYDKRFFEFLRYVGVSWQRSWISPRASWCGAPLLIRPNHVDLGLQEPRGHGWATIEKSRLIIYKSRLMEYTGTWVEWPTLHEPR